MHELSERIKVIVRRKNGFYDSIINIERLMINTTEKRVYIDGIEINATGKEYAILELLAIRRGSVISKETFLNHLYGGLDEPEIKIIDVFVCKLRKKLSTAGVDGLIITIWGRGYSLRLATAVRPNKLPCLVA